jgi:hypothetical protein
MIHVGRFSQGFLTNKFVVKPLDALGFPFEKTEGYGSEISEKTVFQQSTGIRLLISCLLEYLLH